MRGSLQALLALTLSSSLLSALAPAQTLAQAPESAAEPQAGELPDAYQRAVSLGLDEFERRNYAEARARFLEAHQIYPNARSLRALGAVEYDLQNYAECIEYLQSALASELRPLQGKLRSETEELLNLARGYVATYTFVLEPADAQLELDGEHMKLRPDGTLLIEVGDHQLGVQAAGHVSTRQALRVAGRSDQTMRITLVALVKHEEVKAEPVYKKWWLWTLVGVVAAGGVAGLAIGLSGREKEGEPTPSNLPGLGSVQALRF
jgi:tetratricopeptide (TPR) repeat protein